MIETITWYKTSERLPEDHSDVIFWYSNDLHVGYFEVADGWWSNEDEELGNLIPSYWAYKPKNP